MKILKWKIDFPKPEEIYPVLGVIFLLTYGWSFLQFFWVTPSWQKYLYLNELGLMLVYQLYLVFWESLAYLLILVLFSVILPNGWLREKFVLKGTIISFVLLGFLAFMNYQSVYQGIVWYFLGACVLAYVLMKFSVNIARIQKIIENIADRTIIFIYLLAPFSLISTLIVLIRKIFVYE